MLKKQGFGTAATRIGRRCRSDKVQCRSTPMGAGIEDFELREVAPVEPTIARQQPVGLKKRVSSNQKVGDQALTRATVFPVRSPGRAGPDCCFNAKRTKQDVRAPHCLDCCLLRGKQTPDLGPHYIARHQRSLKSRGVQKAHGQWSPLRVGLEHVGENRAIYSGDQGNSALPRISSIHLSVDPGWPRMP